MYVTLDHLVVLQCCLLGLQSWLKFRITFHPVLGILQPRTELCYVLLMCRQLEQRIGDILLTASKSATY